MSRIVLIEETLDPTMYARAREALDPNAWAEEACPDLHGQKVRVVVEAVHPQGADLNARIAAIEGELRALRRLRGGRQVSPQSTSYWCACGVNTVQPESGEDTCHDCLQRI